MTVYCLSTLHRTYKKFWSLDSKCYLHSTPLCSLDPLTIYETTNSEFSLIWMFLTRLVKTVAIGSKNGEYFGSYFRNWSSDMVNNLMNNKFTYLLTYLRPTWYELAWTKFAQYQTPNDESCSPDPTTNSETTNSEFSDLSDCFWRKNLLKK